MSTPVTLPALGESVTEGTVTRWLKQVGDTVAVDEPLLEVSTDKVDTEIPSPVAGVLLEIKAQEDETVEVGAELCVVGDEGESAGSSEGGSGEQAQQEQQEQQPVSEESGEQASAEQQESHATEQPAEEDVTSSQPAQAEQPGTGAEQEQEQPAAGTGDGGGSGGTPVTLPALGESVTEGTVTRWLKSVGDEVAVDEPLLEVSTDKVDTEIPSPVAGTLLEIKVEEDETVEVGAELAVIGSGSAAPQQQEQQEQQPPAQERQAPPPPPQREQDQQQAQQQDQQQDQQAQPSGEPDFEHEPQPEMPPEAGEEPEPQDGPTPQEAQQEQQEQQAQVASQAPPQGTHEEQGQQSAQSAQSAQPAQSGGGGRDDSGAYVTPLVRKMAAEHGVDLSTVQGSGVGGRIRKQDVLAAAEAARSAASTGAGAAQPAAQPAAAAPSAAPSPLRGTTEPMTRLRKVIASRMVDSLQTSAQLTQVMEVDVTNIARLRDAAKAEFLAREGVKLTYLPFFAKAAIDALKVHPKLNANIDTEKGEVTYFDRENIAFAVDTDKGLLTPVVKDAGDLSIAGLAKKIADVAERTRTNKIGPDDLTGGTFTITNLGTFGALFDTPIINQPQVAILGPGVVTKRPVVIDDPNLGETIAVRHMVYLALTYDHRLVDGADAGRFLADVKARLEAGQFEV
jgi:2-oxoglutarate dehydrogenase E2 component (dihydrolipoamide succinyltransferase)